MGHHPTRKQKSGVTTWLLGEYSFIWRTRLSLWPHSGLMGLKEHLANIKAFLLKNVIETSQFCFDSDTVSPYQGTLIQHVQSCKNEVYNAIRLIPICDILVVLMLCFMSRLVGVDTICWPVLMYPCPLYICCIVLTWLLAAWQEGFTTMPYILHAYNILTDILVPRAGALNFMLSGDELKQSFQF